MDRRSFTVVELAAAIALGLGALAAIWLFARALALIVLAVTLASALAPPACWLARWMPRAVAVVTIYLVFAGLIVGVGYVVAPSLSSEISQLGQQLPDLATRAASIVGRVFPIDANSLSRVLQQLLPRLVQASSSIASAGVDILIVVFLSLYFLIAAPGMNQMVIRLAPPRQRRRLTRMLARISHEMGGYFRGAALNGVIVACLTWIALRTVGLDYAVPLAVLALFGELIPYLGPVVAAAPAVALAATVSTTMAVTVVIVYMAIQQIEGHVLTPFIMHTQTHLSPALVLVALAMGYSAAQMLGAITAIPVAAAARVVVLHAIVPAIRRRNSTRARRARTAGDRENNANPSVARWRS
jgi:predicted PurR-regulated permease PerM